MEIFIIVLSIIIFFAITTPFIYFIVYRSKCRKDEIKRLDYVEACEDSYFFVCNNLSYVVSVDGKQGAGKTSIIVGLTQYDAINYQYLINQKIDWIKVIVNHVNYVHLNDCIKSFYAESRNANSVYHELLKNSTINDWFHGIYSDYVQKIPLPDLLKSYVFAYCAMLRDQYVGGNIKVYCPINDKWSFTYSIDNLEIKNSDVQKNYYLPKYCSIINDEALLSIYKNTNNNSIVSDTGLDLSLRLIRHLTLESVRIYMSAQSTQRQSKIIRELSTSFIHVNGYEIVGQFRTKDKVLKRRYDALKEKIDSKDLNDVPSFKKTKLRKLFQARKKLFASCFIQYHVFIYSQLEDVGKLPDNCESEASEIKLTFPLSWIFGCYETHEFKFIDEFLENLSNKNDVDLEVAKECYTALEKENKAKKILEKVEKAKEKEVFKNKEQRAMYDDLK